MIGNFWSIGYQIPYHKNKAFKALSKDFAECRNLFIVKLNTIMLSVVMMSVIVLSVVAPLKNLTK